jgi:hypothetical protein
MTLEDGVGYADRAAGRAFTPSKIEIPWCALKNGDSYYAYLPLALEVGTGS